MIKILTDKEYNEIMIARQQQHALNQQLETLQKEYMTLLVKVENTPHIKEEYSQRLADLEVKMAKLWGLLLETTPLGKDKLSKFGKRFGGKSKGMIS